MLQTMWEIFIKNYPMFVSGVIGTLKVSLIGTFVGLFIGLIVGTIRTIPTGPDKSQNFFIRIIKAILGAYVHFFRGTPMMVQAMVFYYGIKMYFNIDLDRNMAAFIIVSINTGAYLSEVVRGGINSVNKGQFEGASAIGMTHAQTMRYVVLPQALKNILPSVGNEFIINVKDTSVLNVISYSELFFTTRSVSAANYMFFETWFVTCLIYLALTTIITIIVQKLEERMSGEKNVSVMGNQLQVGGNDARVN